ncbi:MAG: hypothetical protein WCP93_02820 [Candidatus Berkelbacteria bacterium]
MIKTHKGFALILVLLFTAISLMVVSAIALSLVADSRANKASISMAEAYNMARSGMNDGYTQFIAQVTNDFNGSSIVDQATFSPKYKLPDLACSGDEYFFSGFDSSGSSYTGTIANFKSSYPAALNDGFYAVQVCSRDLTGDYIKSIGGFGGKQVVLKGILDHSNNACPTCDFSKENMKVFQITP